MGPSNDACHDSSKSFLIPGTLYTPGSFDFTLLKQSKIVQVTYGFPAHRATPLHAGFTPPTLRTNQQRSKPTDRILRFAMDLAQLQGSFLTISLVSVI